MTALHTQIIDTIRSGITDPLVIAEQVGCKEWTVYRVAQEHELTVGRTKRVKMADSLRVKSCMKTAGGEVVHVPLTLIRRAFGVSELPRAFECKAIEGKIVIERAK